MAAPDDNGDGGEIPPLPDFLNRKLYPRTDPVPPAIKRELKPRNKLIWPKKAIDRIMKAKAREAKRRRREAAKLKSKR